jgi:ribosome biogenesis ATPase
VDLKKIAFDNHCDGYSGADLSALVREAQMSTLKSSLQDISGLPATLKVLHKDFISALQKVFPSVSKKDENSYKALEGSLRKSRASINQQEADKEQKPVTPSRKPFVL